MLDKGVCVCFVSLPAPGVMSLGFKLIFLCWSLEPESQAEPVSAGSHHTAVSEYTSSWKNSFWRHKKAIHN